MKNDHHTLLCAQPPTTHDDSSELVELPATPSFSFADANCIVDIEIQADQLLAYIDKLTSLADRACNTAIRQSETTNLLEKTRFTEIINLRNQLEQQRRLHQEQQLALLRLEHESKAQIVALENQLRQIEIRLQAADNNTELRTIRAEKAALASRLVDAEATSNRAQPHKHDEPTQINQEMAELKLQLTKRDETIESKNRMIKEIERDFRAKVSEVERRLSDAETELQIQETKLKEKDSLIQRTAIKEVEIGNLIKRLSTECSTLSNELQEKNKRLSQIESKIIQPNGDVTIWRRMIGRLQEEPQ